jgi:hypothetical protein
MKASIIYKRAEQKGITYFANCTGISIKKHEELMLNSTKANGKKIRKLIKKKCPDLAYSLALDYPNPYEHQSRKKDGLLIYVHSGIEYFLKIN